MFRKLQTKAIFSLIAAVMMSLILVNVGMAAVWTDQADYAPGSTVTISGDNGDSAGFLPGETLHVDVSGPNGYTASCGGVADTAGAWSCQVVLRSDSSAIGDYSYTAIGLSSHISQNGTFTDGMKIGSVSVGTQSPNPVTVGNSATYTVTIFRGTGSGTSGSFTANLSLGSLPVGTSASFYPSSLTFGSSDSSKSSSLTISTTGSTPLGATTFWVTATRSDASVDSVAGNGILNIQAPPCTAPTVTTNPSDQSVIFGSSASFAAEASGNPAPEIRWQIKPNSGASWSDISGATSASLTVTAPSVSQSGSQYRAVFTNSCTPSTATSSAATLTVNKAAPTVAVNGGPFTYDGTAHAATAAASGVGGAAVSGSFAFTYDGSSTTPTNAKTYAVVATFTSSDPNYSNASGSGSVTINPKDASVTANAKTKTYGEDNPTLTATITGTVNSDTLNYNLATTAVKFSNVGGYPITVTLGSNPNYTVATMDSTLTVGPRALTITANSTSKTFGDTITFAGTEFFTGAGQLINGDTVTSVTLVSAGSAATATVAGSAYAITPSAAVGSGLSNYDIRYVNGSLTVNKAPSITTVSGGGTYIYDGAAHPATVTVTGAGGLSLAPDPVYSGNCSSAPVNVNETPCNASYTYTGDSNHDGSSDSAVITIIKASSTTALTFETGPYVYRGSAFTATATATGAGGLNQSVTVVYSGDCTNVTTTDGCTATATFDGDTNHFGSNDSKSITIIKADATITVTPYSVTLDGNAHTATGSATGVKGESLNGLDLSGTTHTNAGDYPSDAWTFTDVTGNYNNASGTVYDNIHFATSGMFYGGPGHTILQPINADGSSVWKARNTIPVKFRVCDVNGTSIGGNIAAVFDISKSGGLARPYFYQSTSGTGVVDEVTISNTPDLQFRWDASAQQWIYNLNTSYLSGGTKYYYHISLIDGSSIDFVFGLK